MVKTALFVGTFLHGQAPTDSLPRVSRATKHLRYYRKIQQHLGFSKIYVSDNGGTGDQIRALLDVDPFIELIRHPYIERGKPGIPYDYLPCWRTVYDYKKAIDDGFEKIIVTDDDAFIVSKKLMDYVKHLDTGWTSLYCPKYGFPECALSVLCVDTFWRYLKFVERPYPLRNMAHDPIELILPYTLVNKDFSCDRWGEERVPQADFMDAYFQCPADMEIVPHAWDKT